METNNLPTDELKKYGIVEPDNSFSKKLSAQDIQKFLQGYTIVVDNKKNRATFQLVENNKLHSPSSMNLGILVTKAFFGTSEVNVEEGKPHYKESHTKLIKKE